MRLGSIAVVSTLVALTVGCASSHVMVGNARPPISPDQVRLYTHPPEKYEEIAIIDSSSKGSFAITQQGRTDAVIARLKDEAAKLGANGILIQGMGNAYGGSVTTGTGTATTSGHTAYGVGTGLSVPVMIKEGSGVAIYVPGG
jgi:hypothetical protein